MSRNWSARVRLLCRFLVGYAAFQLSLTGYGYFTVWPAWPGLTDAMVFCGMTSGCLFSTAFTINLLDLKTSAPQSRYFQYYLQMMALAVALLYLMIGYRGTILFAIVSLVIPWLLFLLVAGFVSLRRRERVAKWYLLAWSFFIFGSLISLTRQLGILPTTFVTNYAQQIGSVIEFILLSFALADRIKTLQERIQIEQTAALAAERHARDSDQKALASAEAALAEQKRLAELKDQFLANTSHELRTPLNGMIGMAESLLSKNYFPAEDRGDLSEILFAANRLSHQVSQILDLINCARVL